MKERPIRKLQRLPGFNYSQNGSYFVTICCESRKNLFGDISTIGIPVMALSSLGLTVQNAIEEMPSHHKEVRVLTYVVMPNHVHLLLEIDQADTLTTSTDLSRIMKGLKAYVSRTATENGFERKVWQNSFHDHIIRDEMDLETHYEYIITNVDRWFEDEYCEYNQRNAFQGSLR